ncbi:signal transduction histidine-protein kinase/phosphatase DegS [Gottschalkia purinilytica]|uniref:histidine kinase n=1 Tax=Gottschalkia purinilytica TaxID=1503 RepID=A0A0L0WDD4_GOTPU|nr:sensor histidine kinase [Gottschalkia purinilytica]KNF09484.1 signal transduction histidine-protein kinase/phosphatase DegS [Gottschalkia purinilytica]
MEINKISEIIEKTINVIDQSRNEIFNMVEDAKKENDRLQKELESIQLKLALIIDAVDNLEIEEKRTRTRLMLVSKNFNVHSEEDIRLVYEEANNLRLKLILKKQEEQNLIDKRTEVELSLRRTLENIRKAEKAVTKVGVAMQYLRGNFDELSETIEDMSSRQYLGVKIIQAQEEERQRVAREIHDGPAQTMANVMLKAELCEKLLSLDINKSREELQKLKFIVKNSLRDIRKIIYDLRPMSLDDLGLIPTIQRFIDNFTEENDIKVEFIVLGDMENINSIVELACFRIVQECLNNIRKHSKAKNVFLKIDKVMNRINIFIKDHGVGFEVDNINKIKDAKNGGFGILGIRERTELLDGSFDITSSLGNGTEINVTIPLTGKDDSNGA